MDPARTPRPVDTRTRLLLLSGLWVFLLAVAFLFRGVILPFAGAGLIAYLIHPAVHGLQRLSIRGFHLPRWVAILVIYAAFFLGLYLFFISVLPQLYAELVRITKSGLAFAHSMTPERIEELAHRAEAWFHDRGVAVALARSSLGVDETAIQVDLQGTIEHATRSGVMFLESNVGDIVGVTRNVITQVVAGIFMLFFVLMVAAFFSIDATNIRRYAASLLPPETLDEARLLLTRIDRSLSGVVRGQGAICLVNGALTFVGLLLFDVKFAFILAFIATIFSLIPIFGTIISSVPIVLIGLSQSLGTGVGILLWIIGIHAVEAYFLNPKIMGSAARIHPVVVAFSLIAGEHTFGLVGALFAVPVASVLVASFDFVRLKAQRPANASDASIGDSQEALAAAEEAVASETLSAGAPEGTG